MVSLFREDQQYCKHVDQLKLIWKINVFSENFGIETKSKQAVTYLNNLLGYYQPLGIVRFVYVLVEDSLTEFEFISENKCDLLF